MCSQFCDFNFQLKNGYDVKDELGVFKIPSQSLFWSFEGHSTIIVPIFQLLLKPNIDRDSDSSATITDTPIMEASWLESFSTDIWAHLAWYLAGEHLGRLMMTGAMLLRQRLKSPNVVRSINLGQDLPNFKSLPKFLNDFASLEELSIHSYNDDWSRNLALNISSIPSGVRKLELSGFWNECANELFSDHGATLKLNEHLPRLETLDLYSLTFADYSWMAHELVGFDLVVPFLPASTRQLDIVYQVGYYATRIAPQNLLGRLPEALTSLHLPESINLNFAHPALVALLPSTLLVLKIDCDLPCSAWPQLPKQLTSLSIRAPVSLSTVLVNTIHDAGVLYEVRSIPLATLPRTITKFELLEPRRELYFCGPPTASNQSYFPPELTSLSIPEVQLSPEVAKLLPSSLTHLEIANLRERVCQHIPNSLKSLKCSRTLLTPKLFQFLPKSLTDLHLSQYHDYYPWFDCNTGRRIEATSELEEYAIYEQCMSKSFDWKDSSPLPRTLTTFLLSSAEELGDSFWLHQQLPNLVDLNLIHSKHFTDLSIPPLSRNLTSLNLASSGNISGKTFESLPKCLTFLDLNSSESIFDSEIQHLPRTLKYANLNHAIHLSDLCIGDLPPNLESLSMRFNALITPASFPRFPQRLRCSQRPTYVEFANWYTNQAAIRYR